ncbi:MAG TPA: hypothetical protein PKJ58_04755 [Prolixibacteraceae bacterium]|nr:hypothetical protein [Prolixibacteraceae bacterium]
MPNGLRKEPMHPVRKKNERFVLLGADLQMTSAGPLITLILVRLALPGLFADLSFSWKGGMAAGF